MVDYEILVERLRASIAKEIAANHAEMDKGKSHDEYMKLVGRNVALTKVSTQTIKECFQDLQRQEDDD